MLVDVDPVHLLIDPAAVRAAVGPRTEAIVPVHLFGQIAPVEEIGKIAADAGVPIIEDAAQSQGALRHGRAAGSFGLAAGTSFYPGKNLGAAGDAGAVTTVRRRGRPDACGVIAAHGSARKYEHEIIGMNSRLDTVQAVVLEAKLRRLAAWNDARRAAAARYAELLGGVDGVGIPVSAAGNEDVWHLYVVQVDERDRVLRELNAGGDRRRHPLPDAGAPHRRLRRPRPAARARSRSPRPPPAGSCRCRCSRTSRRRSRSGSWTCWPGRLMAARPRVVLVHLNSLELGGTQINAVDLAAAVVPHGYESHLIGPEPTGTGASLLDVAAERGRPGHARSASRRRRSPTAACSGSAPTRSAPTCCTRTGRGAPRAPSTGGRAGSPGARGSRRCTRWSSTTRSTGTTRSSWGPSTSSRSASTGPGRPS